MLPATLQFLVTMIACAVSERMQRKLDYTQEEVRVLKEILAAITGGAEVRQFEKQCRFTAEKERHSETCGRHGDG
jgi:hypothetical protein